MVHRPKYCNYLFFLPFYYIANIIYNKGKYYPFIYVSDGKRTPEPIQLNGDENLENLITSLKNVVTPNFVNGLMTNPN